MSTRTEVIDGKLCLTRTFDAPRSLVFDAWTRPEMVQTWWGCSRTTSVESTIDLRVGGEYRHVMQLEGIGPMTAMGTFTVVDPPERIAYTSPGGEFEGMPPMPDTTTTVVFVEVEGRTELRMTIEGLAGTPYLDIVQGGWGAGLEKLEKQLASQASA